MRITDPDILVVGAGFAGAVIAREMAERGAHVVVVDRRPHVAGNAYDERDADGVLLNRYGPHLFHTEAEMVHSWLSRFTEWHRYEDKALPAAGYTAMFRHILHHRRIEVRLRTSFDDVAQELRRRHLVWTGAIDEYFGLRFGRLPYTGLRFEWGTVPTPGGAFHQPAAQVLHPGDDVPYARSTEFRHYWGQRRVQSTIAYEYPCDDGEPFFPVATPPNVQRHEQYLALAATCTDVTFAGRLTRFRYLRMDQVAAQALAAVPVITASLALRQAA